MSVLDRFRSGSPSNGDGTEQLATDDPDPRGEHRDTGGFLFSFLNGRSRRSSSTDIVRSDRSAPPEGITEYWERYYKEFSLTRRPLQTFSSTVAEPGYKISATVDDEPDDEMQEALELWAQHAAIHAAETGQDLTELIREIPAQRRGRGTIFLELAGTRGDADALGGLSLLDPATIKIYKRESQNILIQPDDNVSADHPTTPDGTPAAYVQYDDDLLGYNDEDEIAFSADEIVKFTYDPDVGSAWGTSVFEAIDERIEALKRKWDDRDAAIHQTGHPHRIYNSEGWTQQEAQEYATAHDAGEVSAWDDPEDRDTFAGRTDFVSDDIEITTEQGAVADISDAVRDDIEAIFAAMPVAKYRIAYAESINQFVVEPQESDDERRIDDERRYLERKFEPIFERKADELASGEEYQGEVTFAIEPDREDNPVMRESFPADNLESLATYLQKSGLISELPASYLTEVFGGDFEQIQEEHDWAPEDLPGILDESTPEAQRQAEAMETGTAPDADTDDGEGDEE